MKHRLTTFLLLSLFSISGFAGQIGDWVTHLAYNNVTKTTRFGHHIYALAGGALYSVDTENGNIVYYNKQNSLHGSTISHISANTNLGILVIFYADGLIDLMYEGGETYALTDLKLKELNSDKQPNSVLMNGEYAYCSMPFGVMVINLKRREITSSYYIGKDGSEENILQTAILGDSIYAISQSVIYAACLKDNIQDYNRWRTDIPLPGNGILQHIAAYDDALFVLQAGKLYRRNRQWESISEDITFNSLRFNGSLFCFQDSTLYEWNRTKDALQPLSLPYPTYDALPEDNGLWIAAGDNGMVYHSDEGDDYYQPDGPAVNIPYRMKVINGKLYVVPGGRWSSENLTPGSVMIYDGNHWTNINNHYITNIIGDRANDFMNVAVDPLNEEHIYVTSYGEGLFEFEGPRLLKHYNQHNSPLETAVTGKNTDYYIRTDGAMFDEDGNLWLLNTSSRAHNVHVISAAQRQAALTAKYARWDTLNLYNSEGERISLTTPLEMFIDNRYSQWKWIPSGRSQPGLILLDDNNTPHYSRDDRVVQRTEWEDQDGNTVRPDNIYTVVQDKKDVIWIGTSTGLLTIPADVDFRTSNRCERIKIARNDGTNLADWLLGSEQINVIAVDGSNRKWIGTAGSGVYLMSADGTETIHHFTTDNSPLLANRILSIAIDQATGLVYIGTEEGLISYQSDAADPMENYSSAYAFPNPVREDYDGVITLKGLMDETVVHIVDNGGNLVCETRSNGGIAVWDGKNGNGSRVSSGVYTAFCNTADGKNHTVIKILVIH